MADQYKTINDAIKQLSRDVRRRTYFDVELLTEAEVEELRRLVADGGAGPTSDATLIGMRSEFVSLGLIVTDLSGNVTLVRPAAHWAIEKHDQRKAEREAEEHRRNRHDLNMALIAAFSGLIGAVLGAIIPALINLL